MSKDAASRLTEGLKLKGASNYLQWSKMISMMLLSKALEHTILSSFKEPQISPVETDPAKIAEYEALLKTWKINNGKAMMAICLNCQTQPLDLIQDIPNAPAM